MKSYKGIAVKYLKENKKRSALTIIGITLAVALIFAITTFIPSFINSTEKSMRNMSGDFEYGCSGKKESILKLEKNANVISQGLGKNFGIFIIDDSENGTKLNALDKNGFNNVFRQTLEEGRLPNAENEIIVDNVLFKLTDKKMGDNLKLTNEKGEERLYKIVGSYKPMSMSTDQQYNFYTFLDEGNISNSDNIDLYLNSKSKGMEEEVIYDVIEEVDKTIEIQPNNQVLMASLKLGDKGISSTLINIATVVLAIVIISTISVIYNSFNISVVERIRYFGILKAAGATKNQISGIVLREGTLMALLAIPLGMISGYLGLDIMFKTALKNGFLNSVLLEISLDYRVVILTIILSYLTIIISALLPARAASKTNIISAIRNSNEIKKEKIKKRKSKFVRNILGIEGELAYKNIRRNTKRFVITVFALTISMIMFNVFYTFMEASKESASMLTDKMQFDALIVPKYEDVFSKLDVEKIENIEGVKTVYYVNGLSGNIPFPENKIASDFDEKNKLGNLTPVKREKIGDTGYVNLMFSNIYGIDYNGIELINEEIKGDKISVDQLEDYGIVISDNMLVSIDGVRTPIKMTGVEIGDKIKLPKMELSNEEIAENANNTQNSIKYFNENINKDEYIEFTVLGFTNRDPLSGSNVANSISLIISDKAYKELTGIDGVKQLGVKLDENVDSEKLYDKFLKEYEEYNYMDIREVVGMVNGLYSQIEMFVYIFIFVITLISTVNIFNTITTNILIRQKEIATFGAVGMSSGQRDKMILLEGALYGLTAFIIGGGASIALIQLLNTMMAKVYSESIAINYTSFIVSGVVTLLIIFISTIIPLRRIKKVSIIDGMRQNE